jgi:hypothetical protein
MLIGFIHYLLRYLMSSTGTLPHTPTVGDVDGDGQLDIAVVAASRYIFIYLYMNIYTCLYICIDV